MRNRKLKSVTQYAVVVLAVWSIVGANYVQGIQIIAFGDSITKGTPYIDEEDGDGRRVGGYEPELEKLLGEAIGRF